jgi:RNA-directed DNA polymerase
LQAIKQELRRSMHQPIPQQGRWLQQVVTGYFNYHAVPTNSSTLTAFLFHVTNLWRRTLRQRSQKDWTTRERIKRLADDWLPKPRILHPWPESRFAVRHPRWEKLWGARRRSWHLHRPYEPMEVAPWSKSMISAEA